VNFFAFKDIQTYREGSRCRDWYRGVNFGWGSPLGDSFVYEAWQGHFELPVPEFMESGSKSSIYSMWSVTGSTPLTLMVSALDCANVLDFQFMKELRQETEQMKKGFLADGRGDPRRLLPLGES